MTRCSGNQMGDQITPCDQIDDQIPTGDQNVKIRSPIWSPGAIWSPIWSSDEACFSSHLFKRPLIFAQKAQLQSNLVTQERSGRPEAIWSPIRSPGHLVVDLVMVDAFSFSYEMDRKLEQENGILSFDKIYGPAVHFS